MSFLSSAYHFLVSGSAMGQSVYGTWELSDLNEHLLMIIDQREHRSSKKKQQKTHPKPKQNINNYLTLRQKIEYFPKVKIFLNQCVKQQLFYDVIKNSASCNVLKFQDCMTDIQLRLRRSGYSSDSDVISYVILVSNLGFCWSRDSQ